MKKTAKNDITGAWIVSKPNTEDYQKNWDLIFGSKKKESRIDVIGQNGNDGIHYDKEWDEMKPVGQEVLPEYELNKSTGEVQVKECTNCQCNVKGCD